MPTPVPGVLRFDIDCSLDTPADGWTAEVAGAELMLVPDDDAVYQLPMGFLDASGNEVLAQQVTHGSIIDRRLVGRVDERRTYIRGVDALADTFDLQRAIRYVPGTLLPGTPAPTEPGIEIKVGTWTAAGIAEDLVTGTGFSLSWEVRDYTLRETFDASGTLYDLLRRLVEPWSQVAPLGVDITAEGTRIRIRPRLLHPPADLTMTVADARLVELTLGPRRRLPLIGTVILEGRPEGWQFEPSDPPEVSSSTVVVPYSIPTYDLAGTLIAQVDGERTFREPDHLLLKHVQREHQAHPSGGLIQVKESVTETTYEPSSYGPAGPLTQPLPLAAVTTIKTLVEVPGPPPYKTLGQTAREEVAWKYDARRFLAGTTTKRFKRKETKSGTPPTTTVTFPEAERIEEVRTEKLPGWLEVATTRTTFDPATGKATGSTTLQAQDQAGFPPGGPRRPGGFDGGGGGGTNPGRIMEVISTDPTAIPIRYSNGNLTQDDLDFLMGQYRTASGLVEYRLSGQGPALPDVTKGSTIHLTGYLDALGTPIPLDPAQIRRIAFTYVDGRDGGEFTCSFEAVFYREEAP
jgi:hypothetical protein